MGGGSTAGVGGRARLLLAGVSLLALAVAGISGADAQAVRIVNQGADGEDSNVILGIGSVATPGQSADGVIYQLPSPISGTSGTAVEIGSIGGLGGAGEYGTFQNQPGADGGNAGDVSVTLQRVVTGGSNQTTSTALVSVYSIGGGGGTGFEQNAANKGFGLGGKAGSVKLVVAGKVAASGNGMAGISAISEGGGAGARPTRGASYGGTGQDLQAVEVGANGGTVTVSNSGTISTAGDNAPAVFVASRGGAGGKAEANTNTYYGSNGGSGGIVDFSNLGTIATLGAASSGVILQSVGGIGGKGAGGAWTAAAGGAAGGNGGAIKGANTGTISTVGDYSLGLVAQSIGASGGQGKNASFGSGGAGGAAGYGGVVTLDNSGTITTVGVGATAIVAQSIGGADALSAFWSTNPSLSGGGGSGGGGGILPWSSGGAGGPGGGAGKVTLTQRGTIRTGGDSAYGALLQSIGGGGGTGGTGYGANAFLSVALGGAGGSGGDGAAVVYDGSSTAGSIETSGSKATGVLAQSIGGGGGAGGAASSKSIGFGLSASFAVGGQGGGGGNGGAVTVSNGGRITTWGANASAINAASIGGGGGNGGNADAFAVALPVVTPSGQSLPSIAISSAVGGTGGDGGSGGAVTASNTSFVVKTYGIGSAAVELQSIGGGGGDAGDAMAYALAISTPQSTSVSVASAIGGGGGGGGNGGKVEFRNSGQIETLNEGATGILAQSIGGGGGNGGSTTATANAVSLRNSFMYTLSVGGSGGRGGNGGDVSVDNSGSYGLVRTFGDNAVAVFGQSIGGGGGNGGDVISVAATDIGLGKGLGGLADKFILGKSFTGTTTLGGSGGDGGSGGQVQITNGRSASLVTFGAQSSAIFAQSVGGGGGTGGGGTEKATGTFALKLSIGGTGGRGGTGGAVSVTQQGTITTFGDASHGIFAQSVGGGGGDGGNLTAMASATPDTISQLTKTIEKAIGAKKYADWVLKNGAPDTKAKLDKLIADLKGSELSQAVQNSALFKQLSSLNDFIKQQNAAGIQFPSVSLTMSMGGTGGSGDTGGRVEVSNQGAITTGGNVAHGVIAQSTGGGGNGGTAYGSGTSKLNLIASLGGSGSSGGTGGSVVVGNSGTIRTGGDAAYGLFAQSVGGGGGTGVGALSSQNKDVTLNVAVGGTGGSGNVGGAVSVTNSNSIVTTGAESHAVLAQSVGGGGGTFMMNLETKDANERNDPMGTVPPDTLTAFLKAFGLEQVPSAAPVDPNAAKTSIKSAALTLGGSGGTGGDGGAVSVVHSGAITTSGEGAFGILAQSVGGGGGLSNAAGSPGGVKWSASLGGSGGAAGNGGGVSVNLTGNGRPSQITTSGNAATGVFAQSVGGGGGYGGASVLLGWSLPGIGGAGGSSGNGGAISVTAGAGGTDIKTTGTFAHGIWAQSLGGGGGAVRNVLNLPAPAPTTTIDRTSAKGRGGAITINIAKGNISATGADSFGILAQSGFQTASGSLARDPLYGSQRGGNININYTGTIVGGSGGGAAIGVDGGGAYDAASGTAYKNTIVIGAGSTISALSGKAILASSGDDNVINHGTIIGDIDLAVGDASTVDSFVNEVDGTYRSAGAGTLKLGGQGVGYVSPFTNRGTFDIGGVGKIATATLTNGTMELGGTLLVDVTSAAAANAPTSDRLQADRLKLDGVAIKPFAVGSLLPGSFTVVTATTWLQGGAAATAGGSEWSPISWAVSQGANSLSISPTASFVAKAESLPTAKLTATERSMLESAQTAWNGGNTAVAGFFAQAANVTTPEQFANLINSASASESNNLPAIGQTLEALQSLNAAMSCPAFEGDSINIHEGQCVWARGIGSRLSRTASAKGEGYEQDSMDYRIGAQWEIAPDWYLGATAGHNNSWMTTSDGLSSTTGTGGDVSVALKHQMGPLLLAASVYGGYGSFDTDNDLIIGAQEGNASNDTELWTAGLKMRAAYEFAFEHWYLRPYVDVNALHSYMPAYAFTANGMTIQSDSIDHWSGELETVLEAGSRIDLGDHGWIRPYVGIGGTFVANNRIVASSSFSDGALKGLTFETTEEIPAAMLDLGAGVQFMSRDNYEVRGQYRAQIAEDFLNQELSLRLSLKF